MAAPRSGTDDFRTRVEAVVAALEPGEVVSYGDVAAEAGFPGAARAVGRIMATPTLGPSSPADPSGAGRAVRPARPALPWWRVVTATGRLVPGLESRHAKLLRAEGVHVRDGHVRPPGRLPR